MAAVADLAAVNKLVVKALALNKQGHSVRSADAFGAAAAAAQQLAAPVCLVVASLQLCQAGALQRLAITPGVSNEFSEASIRQVWLTLLPAAWATVEARRRGGTLLSDCSPTEQAFFVAYRLAMLGNHAVLSAMHVEAVTRFEAPLVGFHALMRSALVALGAMNQLAAGAFVAVLPDHDAFVALALREVDAMVDAMVEAARRGALPELGVEAQFIQSLSLMATLESSGTPTAYGPRLLHAWSRLGNIPQMPSLRQAGACSVADARHTMAAAIASAAQPGRRGCARDACREREVHASQFKRCAACSTVVYCGKACQTADWPAHKAACKAARKAAAAAAAQHELPDDAAGPSRGV
jgi:hypothetical protein